MDLEHGQCNSKWTPYYGAYNLVQIAIERCATETLIDSLRKEVVTVEERRRMALGN